MLLIRRAWPWGGGVSSPSLCSPALGRGARVPLSHMRVRPAPASLTPCSGFRALFNPVTAGAGAGGAVRPALTSLPPALDRPRAIPSPKFWGVAVLGRGRACMGWGGRRGPAGGEFWGWGLARLGAAQRGKGCSVGLRAGWAELGGGAEGRQCKVQREARGLVRLPCGGRGWGRRRRSGWKGRSAAGLEGCSAGQRARLGCGVRSTAGCSEVHPGRPVGASWPG